MFLATSELAPAVVLPASSRVGSPVERPVFGSAFAGTGQAKSTPVPALLTVPVESGWTGVGAGEALGETAALGEGDDWSAQAMVVGKSRAQIATAIFLLLGIRNASILAFLN